MVYVVESCHKKVRGKRKKNRGPNSGAREVDQPYDEGAPFNPHLKAAIVEAVENQTRNGDPSETQQTLTQLLAVGYLREQAIEMTGSALVEEIWAILHDHKLFDRARFATLLEQLG